MSSAVSCVQYMIIKSPFRKRRVFAGGWTMKIIDNVSRLLGDELKDTLRSGAKLRIVVSSFSIYVYEALKQELEALDSVEFIFTSPTFVPEQASNKLRKERCEFHIPMTARERGIHDSEFEIHLKNKLTQQAMAWDYDDWMGQQVTFRSYCSRLAKQPFLTVAKFSTCRVE